MTLTEWEDMWIDLSRAQREALHVDWDAVIADWEQSFQKKVGYLDLTAGGFDGQRTQAENKRQDRQDKRAGRNTG